MRPAPLATLFTLLGCAATLAPSGDAAPGPDVIASDAPAVDVPATDAGEAIRCGGEDASFPTFATDCAGDGDCALAVHQTNCCGDHAALGLARTERARFDAAEATCRAMYPGCGCPTRGTLADDGQWSTDPAALRVACRAGRCVTSVASAPACPGVTCGPGQLCARGCCGVPGCTPSPSRCVRVPEGCEGRPSCECLGRDACGAGGCVGVQGGDITCICA